MSSQRPWRRLYNTARWRKGRAVYLAKHPLCAYCARIGRTAAATVVDHITPHKGDEALFFSETNWQGLCAPCHDSIKHAEEHGRLIAGTDVDGNPVDPGHPWNGGR